MPHDKQDRKLLTVLIQPFLFIRIRYHMALCKYNTIIYVPNKVHHYNVIGMLELHLN